MSTTASDYRKETTIYRILGNGHLQISGFVQRDPFTFTLLALVLMTNLLNISVPSALSFLNPEHVGSMRQIMTFTLSPGYLVLFGILLLKCRNFMTSPTGRLKKEHPQITLAPRLKNVIAGIQCLLIVSLVSSTFILDKQLEAFQQPDELQWREYRLIQSEVSELPKSLFPLLRQFITM